MAEVIITEALKNEILKKFKGESKKIFKLMRSLKENPKKGKEVGCVSNVVIKEIKYEGYRFYFITNGFSIKFLDVKNLQDLIIKFVRMSNKKEQQKVINEIKNILRKLGESGF
jgi:hypothetical protein